MLLLLERQRLEFSILELNSGKAQSFFRPKLPLVNGQSLFGSIPDPLSA